MIDWELAERLAVRVAGEGNATRLPGDLQAICADGADRVISYARLDPGTTLAPPESVTRAEWISANLVSMQSMLDPVADQIADRTKTSSTNPMRLAGEVVITAEAGAVTGYLGKRVLGQYVLSLLDAEEPPRLLFVEPNISGAAVSLGADPTELLRWIAFHETTHAVQFTAVPWLREHLGGMLTQLMGVLETEFKLSSLLRLPTTDDVRGAVDRLRSGSLVGLVAGAEQRAILDSVQSTMALIEGHAEHVMDAAGVDALPSLPKLRASLERRRADRPPVMRVLERLLGMELKMKQYAVGKKFCDAVVAQVGIDGLNRAWADPASLPTLAELDRPGDWIARVAPRGLAA